MKLNKALFPVLFALIAAGLIAAPLIALAKPGNTSSRMGKPPKDRRGADDSSDDTEVSTTGTRTQKANRAQDLLEQARNESDPQQSVNLKLQACQALIESKLLDQAKVVLSEIDPHGINDQSRAFLHLLQAQIALAEQNPQLALKLTPVLPASMPARLRAESHRTRAIAYRQTGNRLQAINELILIDNIISDPNELTKIHQSLWNTMQQISTEALKQFVGQTSDPRAKGWMELAIIHRESRLDPQAFNQKLGQWKTRYNQHPAINTVIPNLATEQKNIQSRPERLALLLPLSGRIKATSTAIRDGFIAAHYASTGNRKKIHFKIYDTSSGNITAIYNKAVSDGAQMVIGPLRKRNVQQLADAGNLQVPVLALNVIPPKQDGSAPDKMYFFGLSPEDEARQVAERAIFVNKLRAVVFIPNTAWGGRVQRAFTERYRELGGKVVETATYQPNTNDFSASIKKLLNLDDSQQRFYALRRTLRTKMEFEPSRRTDAEFLFVAGFARQIRLIAPQLKFHQARDLPIYATSHVYTGVEDTRRDNDMNGIIFCDTPWNLSGKDNMHPIKQSIAKNWPGRLYGLSRLFALGADAYNVVPYLTWLKSQPFERFNGQTGMLSVDKYHRIRRTLQWAKFDKGKATILQERINTPAKQSTANPNNARDTPRSAAR